MFVGRAGPGRDLRVQRGRQISWAQGIAGRSCSMLRTSAHAAVTAPLERGRALISMADKCIELCQAIMLPLILTLSGWL